MTPQEVRAEWEALRDHLDQEAQAAKESQSAVVELSREFGERSPAEQNIITSVLAEWLDADDDGRRFDALVLIGEHQLRAALPALRRLYARLAGSGDPGAPFEREQVQRVIARLGAS